MKIFVDAGHSGSVEPGACYFNFRECDVALNIALKTGKALINQGFEVVQYRTGEIKSTSLTDRAVAANQCRADFFLSVHCNAFTNGLASGVEAYYYALSNVGKEIAGQLCGDLKYATGFLNRGAKTAAFTVLTATAMPAVLLEVGFLSNRQEADYLTSESGSNIIASAVANTLVGFFGRNVSKCPMCGRIF